MAPNQKTERASPVSEVDRQEGRRAKVQSLSESGKANRTPSDFIEGCPSPPKGFNRFFGNVGSSIPSLKLLESFGTDRTVGFAYGEVRVPHH
jgi:hypothetical protein